jgi:type IV secretory pathway VirB4 component
MRTPTRELRLPRHRATTAHACSAYPFQVDTSSAMGGVVLGLNITAGGAPFAYDAFAAYNEGRVTNPNVLVVGEPGVGKSALLKCLISRSSALLGRWVAIIDPKGEYADLADRLGLAVVKLHPGGEQRLNPLHRNAHADEHDASVRQATMIAALVASVLRRDLTPLEDAAVGWTTGILARREAEPTLADLAACLASPTKEMAERAHVTPAQLARGVDDVVFGLGKLLDRSLRGMFDGPSTIELDPGGPGVVIDLSAVHHDPDALGLVMIAATAWLQSVLAQPGPPRLQVLDEAWALLANERAARYLQACFKLGRSYGVANVAVVHRLSDLRAQADDGTALAKVTAGFLADAQTRIVFRQAADQVPDAQEALGLTETEAAVLSRLARGRALWKLGAHAAVVQHLISSADAEVCDTDRRMAT